MFYPHISLDIQLYINQLLLIVIRSILLAVKKQIVLLLLDVIQNFFGFKYSGCRF